VGIDIELHRAIDDLQPLIDGYCSPAEIAALAALPPASRCIAFLGAWTRKEAALKAWGTGIGAVPLDQFHVGLVPADRFGADRPLPGLHHDGIRYPDLRLASMASGDEVLSVAAACAGSFVMRMPSDAPRTS